MNRGVWQKINLRKVRSNAFYINFVFFQFPHEILHYHSFVFCYDIKFNFIFFCFLVFYIHIIPPMMARFL